MSGPVNLLPADTSTQCPPRRAPASPGGCNPPANAVQVRLLPDTLTRPVRLLARSPVFQAGQRGSKPLRATERPGGGMADTRSLEGRAPRGVRVQVPPWPSARGGSASVATAFGPP